MNHIMFNNIAISIFLILAFTGCSTKNSTQSDHVDGNQEEWQVLFNGTDLSGWDTYLGPMYNSGLGDFDGEPVGLNNDPRHVFTVVEEDGEKAIRISGEEFGGISTKDEFENYHLRLQFKWGEKKSPPRDKAKRDSGLLYHAYGPHGADWFFWMKSQEFQIQEGDCGDYWGLGSMVDIPALMKEDSAYFYDESGPLLPFGASSLYGRNVKKYPDAENPKGQWNTLDLYTHADTSYHVVNGVLTMKLYNSRKGAEDSEVPLTKGKIQIQSEGAEVFYRDIKIRPLNRMPESLQDL